MSHRTADYDLDPQVLAALWAMEDRHFWHAARNQWIERALTERGAAPPARLLDVGCGSGTVATHLHGLGYRVTGIDTGEAQVHKASQRCPQVVFVTGSVEDLPPQEPFDVLAFCDVLEHLDDPRALLRGAMAHARSGALVLATVPGMMSLFTVVDAMAGHKRRYEAGELAALLREERLTDVQERGIFRMMLPILRVRRGRHRSITESTRIDIPYRRAVMANDMRVPAWPLNAAARGLCALEARFGFGLARGRRGPTLLATARVP